MVRHFKCRWMTHGKSNFDRKFYIFDSFAEKQFPYQKRNNVCADRRLKIESPPLRASKKQSNEIHRNLLLVDQSTTSTSRPQLVHRCKFNSFIHSLFILQPVTHSFKD